VEETGVPGENHWPATSHLQTLSYNVAWAEFKLTTLVELVIWYLIQIKAVFQQYRNIKIYSFQEKFDKHKARMCM